MRSSDGTYVDRLDHLRALAVFMVFFWHFVHGSADHALLPLGFVPPVLVFPASLFEEGHAGVSLFMVLSGYLFTRLIGSRDVRYSAFLRNRALRLLPMLVLVLIPEIIRGRETVASLVMGFVHGGWSADGTWSIMVEIQFYVLLPLMLGGGAPKPHDDPHGHRRIGDLPARRALGSGARDPRPLHLFAGGADRPFRRRHGVGFP